MDDAGCEIIFLAGHLAGGERARNLGELVDRLAALGHASRVLCLGAACGHAIADLEEYPGLARRWRLPWATRGLRLDAPKDGRPRLLHVLEAGLGGAGLEIAERWSLPYLLAIDEFPARDDRIRLSRAWCRGLVTGNRELAAALRRDFGVPAEWVHEVPSGICPPIEGLPAGVREGRVPVVGAAGPLTQGSGFATFLSAARKVLDAGLDAEFLIAGQGEDEIELRRRAERLKITDRITFADEGEGHLAVWNVLDVFCQTSVAPTVGRSLSMAMAHGVPSIVSDVEGLRTRVADGVDGLQVPAGDPGALARAILALLEDPDRARSLGDAGRAATLMAHDPDREAARLDRLYRELATGPEPEPDAAPEPQAPGLASRPAVPIPAGRVAVRIGAGALAVAPSRGPVPRPSRRFS